MKHIDSTVVVFFSNEYSRFKMINGNRPLNEPKIKRIIREIQNGNDMLRYYPIQVRENKERLEILDGQHRFYICKKLKVPVFYILVKEDKSMPDIARINSNVGKWSKEDYINCYVQQGNKNYQIIRDYLEKNKYSLSVILLLLKTGTPGTEGTYPGIMEEFQSGYFEVKEQEKAEQLAAQVEKFNSFTNYRSRGFVIAIYRIIKANLISIDDLLKAYQKKPEMLTEQANYKAYINTLEQIVNVGKQKRIVIV